MSQAHTGVSLVPLVLSLFPPMTGTMMVAALRKPWVSSAGKLDSNKLFSESLSDRRGLDSQDQWDPHS